MRNHSCFFLNKIKLLIIITAVILLFCFDSSIPNQATAEKVYVKYRGYVDLSPFSCEWITISSFINRLCYDKKDHYVIVQLRNTYYHYCEVPKSIVDEWRHAKSMGRFYNSYIKGNFDCRFFRVPDYNK